MSCNAIINLTVTPSYNVFLEGEITVQVDLTSNVTNSTNIQVEVVTAEYGTTYVSVPISPGTSSGSNTNNLGPGPGTPSVNSYCILIISGGDSDISCDGFPQCSPGTCPCAGTTPTPTQTPTVTPTPCPCNEFSVNIDSTDTSDATGNTGGFAIYNGVVVWTYTDCTTGLLTEYLLPAGTYNYCACGLSSQLTYYKNDSQLLASVSTATPGGPCSLGPSPTPTVTPSTHQQYLLHLPTHQRQQELRVFVILLVQDLEYRYQEEVEPQQQELLMFIIQV